MLCSLMPSRHYVIEAIHRKKERFGQVENKTYAVGTFKYPMIEKFLTSDNIKCNNCERGRHTSQELGRIVYFVL